ncbi:MAG: hypothetical protein QOJ62_1530, partial [Actinomycetota bacterium]|nr:hypothetical protein [Actinomycetota bacterium]
VFQGNGTGLHLTPFAMTTVVRDSVFRANGAGIVMDACNVGETCLPVNDEFVGNVFTRNRGDGISWGYGTVSLSRNHFVSNRGWGFVAAAGTTVTDGGGNSAHGNVAGQCRGLTCS